MDRLKYLMGLMVACPLIDDVHDCPFSQFRESPIDSLISSAYDMDLKKSMDMIEHHKNCIERRKQMLKAG